MYYIRLRLRGGLIKVISNMCDIWYFDIFVKVYFFFYILGYIWFYLVEVYKV